MIKMIKTIIDYVNYHYQFCENIDSFLLTNNLDTNEYYIKSCLIYKYLYEIYFRKNITLREVMSLMDNSDFYFIINSNVLKNHLIFHYAFKNFYKKYKKEDLIYTSLIPESNHPLLDFLQEFCIGFFIKV